MNSRLPCSTFLSWCTTTSPVNSAVSALASNSTSLAGHAPVRADGDHGPALGDQARQSRALARLLRRCTRELLDRGLAFVGDVQLGRLERRVALHGDDLAHEQRRLVRVVDVELVGGDIDRLARIAPEAGVAGAARPACVDEMRCAFTSPMKVASRVSVRMVMLDALHPAGRHRQVDRLLGDDAVLLVVDHGARHPRLHAVGGIDLDAVVQLELALGVVEQAVLGFELSGDIVGLQEVAVDVDQLDRRFLVELDSGGRPHSRNRQPAKATSATNGSHKVRIGDTPVNAVATAPCSMVS